MKFSSRHEIGLWIFFIILCFGAGYIKAEIPQSRWHFFWTSPEKVKILTFSEKLVPEFLIDDLQKRTRTNIEIDVSTTQSDFLAKSVSRSDYTLFLIPRNWSEALRDQGLLLPLSGLKSFFQKQLHPDFPALNSRIFPWAWVPSFFITSTKTDLRTIKSIQILKDYDHLYQILKIIKIPNSQVQLQAISLFEDADEISLNQIKEINGFRKSAYGDIVIQKDWPESLHLFDIVVPRNAPDRVLSIELLKACFEASHLTKEFAELDFGVTQSYFDSSVFPAEKKPSSIRNQSLKNLLRAHPIEATEMKTFLRSFKIENID